MSQFQCRFTHSFANQKPGDGTQGARRRFVRQLEQIMHTLAAGKHDQRREPLFDQALEIGAAGPGELASVYLGIVDVCATVSQFVTEQVATLLTTQYQHAPAFDVLQQRRLQQGFAIVGLPGDQAVVEIESPGSEGLCQRRARGAADYAEADPLLQSVEIDQSRRAFDRVAADEEQDIRVRGIGGEPISVRAAGFYIDDRKSEHARTILFEHASKFDLLVSGPCVEDYLPLQFVPGR